MKPSDYVIATGFGLICGAAIVLNPLYGLVLLGLVYIIFGVLFSLGEPNR